ncbi:type I restriction endonuclease subunit R [bacterium]|nr:type I restriction endonuclease subunit R [bacterium]MBO7044065.1 type I restriction endonuclease subunit R [bacterium]
MKNKKPLEKTKIIQTYAKIAANEITFDKNKKPINIKLIEKDPRYFHNNLFQVIYQFEQQNKEKGRYDVVILINGLPILQIELKKHNIPINQAFNQITRYKNKVFNDLFEFVQLFVISNQIDTKYFSNTTYENAVMLNSNDSFSLQNKEVNNP